MSYKNDAVIMLLLFLNCLGKSDVLCLGGMMWKKAAVEISDALIHITSPVSVCRRPAENDYRYNIYI